MIFQCLGVVTRNHLMPVVCGVYSVAVSTTVIINTFSVYPFGRNILISDPTQTPHLVHMPKCVSLALMSKEHSVSVLVSKLFFLFVNRATLLMKRMTISRLQRRLASTAQPSPASLIVSCKCLAIFFTSFKLREFNGYTHCCFISQAGSCIICDATCIRPETWWRWIRTVFQVSIWHFHYKKEL